MPTVDEHFADRSDDLRMRSDRLVALTETFGPVEQDPTKSSIHLNRGTAFAGVAVRKGHIVLTIPSDRPLDGPRVFESQRTSAQRVHHQVRVATVKDLDTELRDWLKAADDLSQ